MRIAEILVACSVAMVGLCGPALAAAPSVPTNAQAASPPLRPAEITAAGSSGSGAADRSRSCRAGKEDRGSELCAAWKAADSTAEAAQWAFWQMLLSGLGFAGLLISLFYTRKATLAAAAANADTADSLLIANRDADAAVELVRISQENAERDLRAYLDCQSIELVADPPRDTEARLAFRLRMKISNYGRTPASDIIAEFEVFWVQALGAERNSICKDDAKIGTISPGDFCLFNCFLCLDRDLGDHIKSGTKIMEITINTSYTDVFSRNRETKSEFEGENLQSFGAIEGTRFST